MWLFLCLWPNCLIVLALACGKHMIDAGEYKFNVHLKLKTVSIKRLHDGLGSLFVHINV